MGTRVGLRTAKAPLARVASITLGLSICGSLAAQVNGPLPQLFPPDNWWNADVSSAPVDPASDAILDFIGRGRRLHPDFGGHAPNPPEIYGMVYASVPGDQPLEPVTFALYGDESDAGAPGRPPGYPIPLEARHESHWIEGGYPGAATVSGDRHMLLVDRDRGFLYELYRARWNVDLERWEAGSGAVFRLDRNDRRPEGWTSADAAGLAILPGLVRHDEVFGDGPIRHAFRFTVRATNGYVFPASHRAGSTGGAPPLGTRLRLRADFDLSPFAPPLRRIFQAMKTHGLILADNGSDMYVQGAFDPRWDNDVLNPAFRSLTAGDFEVVELGWRPAPATQPAACVPSPTSLCLRGNRIRVQATWRSGGQNGQGRVRKITDDTGAFWFFDSENVEVLVKVLDACGFNQRFWVFASGLTDVAVTLTVTDTASGQSKTYQTQRGKPFRLIQDTSAFACP
jgi:hypothetical protein